MAGTDGRLLGHYTEGNDRGTGDESGPDDDMEEQEVELGEETAEGGREEAGGTEHRTGDRRRRAPEGAE